MGLFKGDVTYAVMTTFGISAIKLVSSLILTRLLTPHAYGLVAAVLAIAYVIEMISDVAANTYLIRHPNADDPRVSNVIWTIRFGRSWLNAALLFVLAPWLAAAYSAPELVWPLRLYSLVFVIFGLESLGYVHATRLGFPRLRLRAELWVAVVSTLVTVALAFYWRRDHWSIIVGIVVSRIFYAVGSHCVRRGPPVSLAWDREIASDMWKFSRVMLPASILTMVLSQLERIAIPEMFDMATLGLLGVASSIAAIVLTLNYKLAYSILYPRLVKACQAGGDAVRRTFYQDNRNAQFVMTALPALIGGAAVFIIDVLFDERYHAAGVILAALMFRSVGLAMLQSSEAALTASGKPRVQLLTNIARIVWVVVAGYAAYRMGGIEVFFFAVCMDSFIGVVVAWWVARGQPLFSVRGEFQRLGVAAGAWLLSWTVATWIAFPIWRYVAHRWSIH